jgi:cation:H+ antiporter
MTVPALLVGAGLVLLYFGAEWLVRGGAALGVRMRVPVIIVGLTVVSIGTSAPEFIVCVLAVLDGNPDLAVGNVMGSNLANIGLILGLAAIVRPLTVASGVVRRDIPWMLAITVIAMALLFNEQLGRIEGGVLAGALFVYLGFLVRASRRGEKIVIEGLPSGVAAVGEKAPITVREEGLRDVFVSVGLVLVGSLTLAGGGRLVVEGATTLAEIFGISQMVIGLSIVAIGTSLPELATTMVAAVRGQADLAIGNIVGSNIFNLTFVLGGTALVRPVAVHPGVTTVEMPALIVLSFLLAPLAIYQRNVTRFEGVLLLFGYAAAWWWMLPAVG